MRLVSVFLAVTTFGYLFYGFIFGQQTNKTKVQKIATVNLNTPAYIDNTPLKAEEVWQQLKVKRSIAKRPIKKKKQNILKKKKLLTIGKNQYVLYGIFNADLVNKKANTKVNNSFDNNSLKAFALIRPLVTKGSSVGKMLKIKQGEELAKGVVLVALTTNSISFKQNNQLIEFRLFATKK